MSKSKLKQFLKKHSWMKYYGNGQCNISHSLIDKVMKAGVIDDALDIPGFLNAMSQQARPLIKTEMFRQGMETWSQEFFPSNLTFPIFHICNSGEWFVTDVDVIS